MKRNDGVCIFEHEIYLESELYYVSYEYEKDYGPVNPDGTGPVEYEITEPYPVKYMVHVGMGQTEVVEDPETLEILKYEAMHQIPEVESIIFEDLKYGGT